MTVLHTIANRLDLRGVTYFSEALRVLENLTVEELIQLLDHKSYGELVVMPKKDKNNEL